MSEQTELSLLKETVEAQWQALQIQEKYIESLQTKIKEVKALIEEALVALS